MADVSIELVREFFEESGFLVKFNRKYIPAGSKREDGAEIDFAVVNSVRGIASNGVNLGHETGGRPSFILQAKDISKIPRAVVKVMKWHSEIFGPGVLNTFHKIFQFVGLDVLKFAKDFFGTEDFFKLLVVPCLPAAKASREKSTEILKSKGVDGVIEFKTVLQALVDMAETNRNYLESNVLQLVRIFKIYDMLKMGQMEFFGLKRKPRLNKKMEPSAH